MKRESWLIGMGVRTSRAMLAMLPLTLSCGGAAGNDEPTDVATDPVIYGNDNRRELFGITAAQLKNADATVAVFFAEDIVPTGDGKTSRIVSRVNGFTERSISEIGTFPPCTTERFYDQPIAPFCTGFLVGPRLVATAGHCAHVTSGSSGIPPRATKVVFGYRMLNNNSVRRVFRNSQIYVAQNLYNERDDQQGTVDFGVYQLDRPVSDHWIASIRRSGEGTVPSNAPLHVIGHPLGLPAKIADGAFVRDNSGAHVFRASLDTYGGNSGSPVINSSTNVVEGILTSGEDDWVDGGGCLASKVCRDDGADCAREGVNRTSSLTEKSPPLVPLKCSAESGQWLGCRLSGCTVCPDKVPSQYVNYFKNHPNCARGSSSCFGSASACSSACPAPGPVDQCGSTSGQWAGCKASGCSVCAELVAQYPKYLANHPNCASTVCGTSSRVTCSAACPAPTEADRDLGCGGAWDALCCPPTPQKPEGDCGPDFYCRKNAADPSAPGTCAR